MEVFIIYLLKANIAFAVLYIFYKLMFNKDTFLQLRRITLLLFYLTAWIYPLVNVSVTSSLGNHVNLYSVVLSEITVNPDNNGLHAPDTIPLSATTLFIALYIIGGAVLLLRTLLELWQIHGKLKGARKEKDGDTLLYITDKVEEPFSFFNRICIPSDVYRGKGLKEVLLHEQTHAREYHSADVLLAQVSIILCWFNPFVWLMRSEVRMIHEYLADRKVVSSGFDKKAYQYRLIGQDRLPKMAAANLYSNFSVLPLKNRIKMLNRKSTPNIKLAKYLMFIPVLGLLLFLSNCQDSQQKEDSMATELKTEQTGDIPEVVAVGRDRSESADDPVFEVIEEMPSFPGGTSELLKYLSRNIKYPMSAQERGIQGRVVAQFVVEKDGSISNAHIVRAIDSELDAEAVRVIESMPKWTPGKQRGVTVRCKYTVPVAFLLQ